MLKPKPSKNDIGRFWESVSKSPSGCWLWTGRVTPTGYSTFQYGGRHGRKISGHLFVYETRVGRVPLGTEIDHLCSVRNCVNPAHLEAVTHHENLLRSESTIAGRNLRATHCPHGHEYTEMNTYTDPRGSRRCRQCATEIKRARRGMRAAS